MDTRKAVVDIGSKKVVIQKRYKVLGAVNDLLIAIWFLTGSILFFFDSMMTGGTWLFVAGSLQLLMRPALTLAELIHIRKADNSYS